MKYDFKKIERKWQAAWQKEKIYEPNLEEAKRPFYNLMMFPYPSGEGLHVGNMYAFTGADIYGRYKRMQGYEVFEPIGLDGFGIHSENYALKVGTHPARQAKVSEKRFYRQLQTIGNGFAWDECLETYDPEYYKWTQWIFTEMWKRGLAYRKKQAVNWCPSCKTVLADEQVVSGKCERCSSVVIKRELEQWFFKITEYAERLLKNLEKLDWSEKVKIAQRNWIGKSEGALLGFPVAHNKEHVADIEVFTTRPDTLFGATYMVLSPEHPLITRHKSQITNHKEVEDYIKAASKKSEEERIAEGKEKTGVELKGIKAINPANKEEISVWVADYVLATYGTGAIMAVPAHDERDYEFAKKYKLPIMKVISSVLIRYPEGVGVSQGAASNTVHIEGDLWEGEGELINSGKFTGMDSEKAKWEITKFVGGKKQIQYRLRDWLISRQRYWGPPIPMIYCPACAEASAGKENAGWQPVPEKDLPVKLPFVKNFRPTGTGESPLASVKSFYETKCPKCGGKAKRETDVSDTFLDSAWYYLRYPSTRSARSGQVSWDPAITRKWLPVNMYIGGAEHSVLHLLYSRFLGMAFHDLKLTDYDEPFVKFRAHGLLISEGAKMSKSKGNVVVPDEYIKKFGADALRMYLMFLAPFDQGGDFRDAAIVGPIRFLERAWSLYASGNQQHKTREVAEENRNLERVLNQTIKKVTEDIERLSYNTAISALMILLNELEKSRCRPPLGHREVFLKLLAPFAPYISEELWRTVLKNKDSIHAEKWPIHDPELIKEEKFTLVIQVNGKVRDSMEAPAGISELKAKELALGREKIRNILGSADPKRVIYIPGKLINIVL